MNQTSYTNYPYFKVDKRIMQAGCLASLSTEAVKLYLCVRNSMQLSSRLDVRLVDRLFLEQAGLSPAKVVAASNEVHEAGLLNFRRGFNVSTFCNPEAEPSRP